MGTSPSPDKLIDEATHHSSSEEFYWAVGEHMRACKGQADHLDELESAIQWCIDHKAVVSFGPPLTVQFNFVQAPTGFVTRVIRGEKLLDVIEHARELT
jgi:hypothetical protein